MSQPFMVDAPVVAKVLDISLAGVYQLSRKNQLPFPSYKLGRILKFKRAEIEEFVGGPIDSIIEECAQ
jgi:predicted DNA-binding transcriptional regulator AlpA